MTPRSKVRCARRLHYLVRDYIETAPSLCFKASASEIQSSCVLDKQIMRTRVTVLSLLWRP